MKKLALIGKDVSKSASPQMHKFIAESLGKQISYEKISIPEDEFESRVDGIIKAYDGVNVTIPYKLGVIPHLKEIRGDALIFGAVNTVSGRGIFGDNTDGLGFMLMLTNNKISVGGKKILIIGAGGAGRSVAKKLLDAGAEVCVYDKNTDSAEKVAREFKGVTALKELCAEPYFAMINASGVGMHKTVGISPVDGEILKNCEVAIDLIYNPAKSAFLEIAEKLGKKIINGRAMLFYQAYYSECIWHEITPNEEQAKTLFEQFEEEII